MIIITGGAGFIGSALIWKLNEEGINDILVVDHLGIGLKWKNLAKRQINQVLHKDTFFEYLSNEKRRISMVFHIGACSATTEEDADYLMENNVNYSIRLFEYCTRESIPFIYASSAATYGAMEEGFYDELKDIPSLKPINKYGFSKHLFDLWVIKQKKHPPFWAGLKFFNVYGPQEYHKGAQASVAFHAFNQIKTDNSLKLFKSHRENIEHGDQRRDFIYIKDVVKVIYHLYNMKKDIQSGIYNIGTGMARSFSELGDAVFNSMRKKTPVFEWIDMPENIRDQYQYFTQANLNNLKKQALYTDPFFTLEDGIRDYIQNYLMKPDQYL
ncbi:MAG: ADP-glyceromanno-heptose 6-epimerase [Oligoflexales bacterium]|nr:ADP-glyceromanno-heptose 6-epimerase [Oligoflexales bacterium]